METMTRTEQTTMKPAAAMVRPGTARMRELTPAQRRAVMFAQQQMIQARAAKKAKAEAEEARRRMWAETDGEERPVRAAMTDESAAKTETREPAELSLREAIGRVLRDLRTRDHKTLREVSEKAGVSLGYLSEVERGQKEASSELLSSIAEALGVSTAQLLRMVADRLDMVGA